jgi:organic radical activating enzyme
MMTSDAIADRIMELLPHNTWMEEHLIITGGEPLLGWQRSYPDLLNHDKMSALKEITFETNGTQKLREEFKEYLMQWKNSNPSLNREITFSVSAKLPCSGEKWEDAIRPDVVKQYEMAGHTYLKFVISTKQDLQDVDRAVAEYRAAGFGGPVYVMPVGGVDKLYFANSIQVAQMAMYKGYRYSPRLQVDIWKNAWGT